MSRINAIAQRCASKTVTGWSQGDVTDDDGTRRRDGRAGALKYLVGGRLWFVHPLILVLINYAHDSRVKPDAEAKAEAEPYAKTQSEAVNGIRIDSCRVSSDHGKRESRIGLGVDCWVEKWRIKWFNIHGVAS